MLNIDVKYLRAVLSVQGLAKISDLGSAKASAVEKAEIDKLSPSDRAERLFCLGAEKMSQEELLAMIQKFPKAYSFSPEDGSEKPEDLNALTTAELEAKLAEEKKITDVVRGTLFTTVTPAPIIKTLEDALKFAEKVKRISLFQQLSAETKTRNQLAARALGLDDQNSSTKSNMVEVNLPCAECNTNIPKLPKGLDLTRPLYCQSCWQKRRRDKTKNKSGT